MKITQIGLYEVPIPPIAKYFPKIYDLTICRIQTDEGIVGLGETHGKPSRFEAEDASYEGKGPLALDPFFQSDPFTCALLDIAGQAFGIPMYRFFGEKVHDRVPVSYWSCPMEPQKTVPEAEVGAKMGFTKTTS